MKYTILDTRIFLSPVQIDVMKKKALKGSAIFNPNAKRIQKIIKSDAITKKVVDFLTSKGILNGRKVGTIAILHSKSGCRRQQWHTDYDPDLCKMAKVKPMGVIFAFENSTYFNTRNRKIVLKKGQVLIFDGDMVHAGSAYEKENTRMHLYLDSDEVPRLRNKTYLVQ